MMFSKYSADKKLVKKLLKGDETSFDIFYEEYFDKLYRFVLSRVGQHHTAEDIVQNSLFNAINKLKTYRGEASLLTWLCTFCRYEMSTYFKTQNRQDSLFEDQPEIRSQIESLTIAIQDQPENKLLQKELNTVIHMTLDCLPERYANVVELKYIQGLSVKEIAGNMGVSAKAIESLLSRARPIFEDVFFSLTDNNKLLYGQQENQS
jgi:RNA polymerase sigma-70 factor (ECF subfamily)